MLLKVKFFFNFNTSIRKGAIVSGNYSRQNLLPSEFLSFLFTITSLTGAGKSSLIEGLKKEFVSRNIKMNFISVGGIMRNYAKELGFSSVEEFSRYNLKHPEDGHDKKCDASISRIGEKNYQVIEGRLPHIFVPKGFHIILDCPLEIRSKRRYEWQNPDKLSFDEVKRLIEQRDKDDRMRYEALYPGCIWPYCDFDLVIDSSVLSIKEEVKAIFAGWNKWILKNKILIIK